MTDTAEAPANPLANREILTELDISEAMGNVLSNAHAIWNPVAVAYTGADGEPQLSFRFSIHRWNGKQLAMWGRDAEGGLVKALASRPKLNMLYAEWTPKDSFPVGVHLSIQGRGRVVSDEAVRQKVYEGIPPIEKEHDPDRRGIAIIIDVDRVTGLLEGKLLQMKA